MPFFGVGKQKNTFCRLSATKGVIQGKFYKPSSVPHISARSSSFIYNRSHLRLPAVYPPATDEQSLTAGVHDLATRQTYCRDVLLHSRWALTPPFHPYPCGRLFSVTLLYPCEYQAVNLRAALCRSDFPPPALRQAAMRRTCSGKDTLFSEFVLQSAVFSFVECGGRR